MPRGMMTRARDAQKGRMYEAEDLFLTRLKEEGLYDGLLFDTTSKEMFMAEMAKFVEDVKEVVLEKFRVKIYNRPIRLLVDRDYKGRNINVRGYNGLFTISRNDKNPLSETIITIASRSCHKHVLLHELAHWVHAGMFSYGNDYFQFQAHGETFASIYLWLVNEILGERYAILLAQSMRRRRVAFGGEILYINGIKKFLGCF